MLTIQSLWPQSMASPNFALSRKPFSEVILAGRERVAAEQLLELEPEAGEVVVRLRIWCESSPGAGALDP